MIRPKRFKSILKNKLAFCGNVTQNAIHCIQINEQRMKKMKTKSVQKALGKFRSWSSGKNELAFQSRANENKIVYVIDQGGNAICLPTVFDADGTKRIAYHPNTIKSLVEFLENK